MKVDEESHVKPYVFWRDHKGHPYRTQDGKYALKHSLAVLGETAKVQPDGMISRPFDPRISWHRLAVVSAIVIFDPENKELNARDSEQIVNDAIGDCIRKKGSHIPVAVGDFMRECNRHAAELYQNPLQRFYLLTTLSLSSFPAKRVKMSGCEISPIPRRAKHTLPPMPVLTGEPYVRHLKQTQYIGVRVKTSGRTINEAADKAITALHALRGLWTLAATYGSVTVNFGLQPLPVGVIHIGPAHSLHHLDGTPAVDGYLIEPNYTADHKIYTPDSWAKAEDFRKRSSRAIRKLPHGDDIWRLIVRYALALDHTNLDLAVLQMWAILEKITDTTGGKYEETIRRATWTFKDHKSAKSLLEHLRFRRNQFVHAASSPGDAEHAVYMVKSFVEPHLLGMIWNSYGVSSIEEYARVLTMPREVETLKKQRDKYNVAIRWRTPRD